MVSRGVKLGKLLTMAVVVVAPLPEIEATSGGRGHPAETRKQKAKTRLNRFPSKDLNAGADHARMAAWRGVIGRIRAAWLAICFRTAQAGNSRQPAPSVQGNAAIWLADKGLAKSPLFLSLPVWG